MTATTTPLIVYSIHGSQFTAKVLAALQHRKIPHYVKVRTFVVWYHLGGCALLPRFSFFFSSHAFCCFGSYVVAVTVAIVFCNVAVTYISSSEMSNGNRGYSGSALCIICANWGAA